MKNSFFLISFIFLVSAVAAFGGCAHKGAGVTKGVENFSFFSSDKKATKNEPEDDGKKHKQNGNKKNISSLGEKNEGDAFLEPTIFVDKEFFKFRDEKNFTKKSKGHKCRVFIPSYVDEQNVFHGKRYIYFTIEKDQDESTGSQ